MIAPSSTNGRHVEPGPAAVGEHISNLAQDIFTLGELQLKLFWVDLQAARARALVPAAILIGGACLLLGTTPILLLAIADGLAQSLGWSAALARLIVALVSFCISAVSMVWATNKLASASQALQRSRSELQENVSWIKNVIYQSMSSTRR